MLPVYCPTQSVRSLKCLAQLPVWFEGLRVSLCLLYNLLTGIWGTQTSYIGLVGFPRVRPLGFFSLCRSGRGSRSSFQSASMINSFPRAATFLASFGLGPQCNIVFGSWSHYWRRGAGIKEPLHQISFWKRHCWSKSSTQNWKLLKLNDCVLFLPFPTQFLPKNRQILRFIEALFFLAVTLE